MSRNITLPISRFLSFKWLWALFFVACGWSNQACAQYSLQAIACTEDGYNLVVRPDGTLWGWLSPRHTQLDTAAQKISPKRLSTEANWQSVVAGRYMVLLLKRDGSLWGAKILASYGQSEISPKFEQLGTGRTWKSIAAGESYLTAISADKYLWAWHQVSKGGNDILAFEPVAHPRNAYEQRMRWRQVGIKEIGMSVVIEGVSAEGSLWRWTIDYNSGQRELMQVGQSKDWASITTGGGYESCALAIKKDGSLWGWGSNLFGQLVVPNNLGQTNDVEEPIRIGNGKKWHFAQAAWGKQVVALQKDSSLWAWGLNTGGQLGTEQYYQTTIIAPPKQIGSVRSWIAVGGSRFHSVGMRADGSLWVWGSSTYEQPGNTIDYTQLHRVFPVGDSPVVSFAAEGNYSAAVKKDGTLWTWGDNSVGQLGLGNLQSTDQPTQVGHDRDWLKVASCAGIKQNGTLWEWGYIGGSTPLLVPRQIGTDHDWIDVVTTGLGKYARKKDGTLWHWGGRDAANGRLPVQVGKARNWASIAGDSHVLATRTDGSMWGWGSNNMGELGLSGPAQKLRTVGSPTQTGAAAGWQKVATGSLHSLALRSDGTLWSCGHTTALGRDLPNKGRDAYDAVWQQIPAKVRWRSIAANLSVSMAVATDGTLWYTGNPYQVFQHEMPGTMYFKKLVKESDCREVALGEHHALVLRADGSLWSYGTFPRTIPLPHALKMRQVL
ncbi:hypothetical protein D3Y59_03460 [Hymenobacter oligotrophus]|uniref:Chromosome condensation regulator RCC1 n=1 Tax=Hymenobacter oligotrophus TaxID=2319843 RepID=A0A3B7QYE6_9BACT|nr:hypothetical protein [Hymenobacter oligotrophus]AYA36203.1 hypothetical protein D3Y59_03460 [Hymenobacter oligotrophus]